jgi:hypothetical protein
MWSSALGRSVHKESHKIYFVFFSVYTNFYEFLKCIRISRIFKQIIDSENRKRDEQ